MQGRPIFTTSVSVIIVNSQGEIHHVLNPNPYHGVFGSDASRYASDLQDHIDHGTSGKVAGFIAETIQVGCNYLSFQDLKLVFITRVIRTLLILHEILMLTIFRELGVQLN